MEQRWNVFIILAILTTEVFTNDEIFNISTSFFGIKNDRNLGHSGYIHVSSDVKIPDIEISSCQSLNVNVSTCDYPREIIKSENTLMAMRAWTAVTMRDNVLGFLGYLLHQRKILFSETMYLSLRLIYDEILKNNVKMMDIIPGLKTIGRASTVTQAEEVFRALKNVMPSYCAGAIDEILRVLSDEKNALKDILRNEKSDEGIDIFRDIEPQLAPFLRIRGIKQSFDKSLARKMGREFAVFYSAIRQKRMNLTQPILGVLMLNMRFNVFPPQDHEDFRFLADFLRSNKIREWSEILIDEPNRSPQVLVETMLEAIANRSSADPPIKEIAEILSKRIRNPQSAYKSHHSHLMDPFFGKSELNISLLLKVLEVEAKIPEVLTLKEMISNGTLNLSYALKGFVRYFYNTPRALASAFIKRVQNRVPMNNEMKNVVSKIVLSLREPEMDNIDDEIVHKQKDTKSKRNADEEVITEESTQLFSDNRDDNFPLIYTDCYEINCTSHVISDFSASFDIGPIKTQSGCPEMPPTVSLSSWLESLNASAINSNITSLLVDVSTILTNFMNDNAMQYLIDDIVNRTVSENSNNSINHAPFTNDDIEISESSTESDKGIIEGKVNSANSTLVETKKDLLLRILRDMLSIKKVRARKYVYYEIVRVYCILIYGKMEDTMSKFLDELHLDEAPLSNIVEIFSDHFSGDSPGIIREFASNQSKLSLSPNKYRTNRLYLVDLLKRILLLDDIRDQVLFNEAIMLIRLIQEFPINMSELLNTEYSTVSDYLERPGILQELTKDIDLGSYRMRGQLGKAILEKLLKLPVEPEFADDIKDLIESITCDGKEAQPIRKIPESTIDRVDMEKILRFGLDKQKLTANVTEAFEDIWKMHKDLVQPINWLEEFDITAYDSRADFLLALVHMIEDKIDHVYGKVSDALELFESLILVTGTGAEPVDYA